MALYRNLKQIPIPEGAKVSSYDKRVYVPSQSSIAISNFINKEESHKHTCDGALRGSFST